jgi:hypothetical protein
MNSLPLAATVDTFSATLITTVTTFTTQTPVATNTIYTVTITARAQLRVQTQDATTCCRKWIVVGVEVLSTWRLLQYYLIFLFYYLLRRFFHFGIIQRYLLGRPVGADHGTDTNTHYYGKRWCWEQLRWSSECLCKTGRSAVKFTTLMKINSVLFELVRKNLTCLLMCYRFAYRIKVNQCMIEKKYLRK